MKGYRLFERTVHDQVFQIHQARIEVEAGELGRIVAEVTGGHCSLEIYEEDPYGIDLFNIRQRIYVPPRRLHVDLDALFQQMTITRPPGAEKVRER